MSTRILTPTDLLITNEGAALFHAAMRRDDIVELQKSYALAIESGKPITEDSITVVDSAGVAHIPIQGVLFNRPSLGMFIMGMMGGASCYEEIEKDFRACMSDDGVKEISFECDSVGGDAQGVAELSSLIHSMRGKKPMRARINGYCASAAYWLCSAADEMIATSTSVIGSIGAYTTMIDDSERDKMQGIKEYVIESKQSPFKVADAANADDRDRVRERLTQIAQVFIDDVARNRGISSEAVEKNYGKGSCFVGILAVKAGLIDEVGNVPNRAKGKSSMAIAKTEDRASIGGDDSHCNSCDAKFKPGDKAHCGACYSKAKMGDDDEDDEDDDDMDDEAKAFQASVMALVGSTDAGEILGALAAMKIRASETDSLKAKIAVIEKEKAGAEMASMINAAVADGRLAPADRAEVEALASEHGMKALSACLKVMKPAKASVEEKTEEKKAPGLSISDNHRKILEMAGVTADDLAKFNTEKAAKRGGI